MMNATDCNRHAEECAANATLSADEYVALAFYRLSAQWRALAVREIYLGIVDASGLDGRIQGPDRS